MSNGLFSVLACSHISAWPLYLLWQESINSQKPMNVLVKVRSSKSLMDVPFLQSPLPLQTDPGGRHILCPVREGDLSSSGRTPYPPFLVAITVVHGARENVGASQDVAVRSTTPNS